MIQAFFTSFKLKNTYRVNSIIYSLKQIPIIKKILPNHLYQNKELKIFGNIVSSLMEFGSIFLGKLLYIFIMIFSFLKFFQTAPAETFLHIFYFLTIAGALMNTYMFNPTKDKYYAMMLMNMDAKKYTLSNYFYAMLKVVVGFLPFTILFGMLCGVPLWITIFMPFVVVSFKMIVSYFYLKKFMKTKIATNENIPDKVLWLSIIVLVLCAYGLPYLNIVMPIYLFLILSGVAVLFGIFSLVGIIKFTQYKQVYRQILVPNNVYVMEQSSQIMKETIAKQIEFDSNISSDKNGFAYFHDIFVKRHRKILTKSAKKQALVILGIFGLLFFLVFIEPNFKSRINHLLLVYLPYFVFIMYFLNRGQVYAQALFYNCDHSMLTYRVFRTPKVILGLFRERLKTLMVINIMPSLLIALGLPLLLFFTGGTDNVLNYFVLFFSIIAMSIFFSVHYLVMYYLLQPYNVSTEMKSSTYSIMQGVTYFVCYFMMQVQLPTIVFGICAILFSVVYSFVSLFIAYKYAPKTFKLRI